jgi:flagellar basal body P-ring formation protein FlgA
MKRQDEHMTHDDARTKQGRTQWAVCLAVLVGFTATCCGADGKLGQGSVRLWTKATVTDSIIRLGDVADVQGFSENDRKNIEDLEVKKAANGREAEVRLAELRKALEEAGLNMTQVRLNGAAVCSVQCLGGGGESKAEFASPGSSPGTSNPAGEKTATQDLPGAAKEKSVAPDANRSLESILREHIKGRAAHLGGAVNVQFSKVCRKYMEFSGDQYEFSIHDANKNLLGLLNLEIDLRQNGQVVGTVPVTAQASLARKVVIAQHPINRGAKVRSADLVLEEREFDSEKALGTVDPAVLIGTEAAAFIPRGNLVTVQDVKPLPLVRRNELVDVYVGGSQYRIKTVAKAMESGSYGQTIQVKSPATGERFYVAVTGEGTTKLNDPPSGREMASQEGLAKAE